MGKQKKHNQNRSKNNGDSTLSSPVSSEPTELQRQRESSYVRDHSRNILELTRPSDRSLSSEECTISARTITDDSTSTCNIGTGSTSKSFFYRGPKESETLDDITCKYDHGHAHAHGYDAESNLPTATARKQHLRQNAKSEDAGAEAPSRPSRREISQAHGSTSSQRVSQVSREEENTPDNEPEFTEPPPPQFPGAERIAPGGRIASYSSLIQEESTQQVDHADISNDPASGEAVTAMAVSREELEEEVRRKLMAEVVTAEAVVPNTIIEQEVHKNDQMERGMLQTIDEEPSGNLTEVKRYRRKIRLLVILLVAVAVIAVVATVATVVAVTQSNNGVENPQNPSNSNLFDSGGKDGDGDKGGKRPEKGSGGGRRGD